MPQIQINPATVTFTANGSATGYATVADTAAIFPGAKGWLIDASGANNVYCIVTELVSSTQFGLRFISSSGAANLSYGRNDLSGYLTGSKFFQELQSVEVQEPVSIKDGSEGGIVTKIKAGTNVTISPTTGVGVVTINASGGGGGGGSVDSVSQGTGITVDNTDPANPIVSLAAIADQRILGNVSGGSAAPIALTQAQIRTFLGLATVATSASAADLSTGTLPAGRMPALTGDITTSAGSVATTLATVNSNVGTFNYGTFTVNAKGLITAASSGATPEVPLTFSTGLNRSVNTVTATLAVGAGTGQTVYGGANTGNDLTLRPNNADTTTGRVVVLGTGITIPNGTAGTPAITGTTGSTTGFYQYSTAAWAFSSNGTAAIYMDSISVQTLSNNAASGFYLGSAGQVFFTKDAFATNGLNIGAGNAVRTHYVNTGHVRYYNVPFASWTSSGTERAQANGEVMAFAAVPPSQTAASGSVLDAYKWDAVTATFTGGTNITTAAGVNFITIERPTYTNASSMSVTVGATVTIKGAPTAAGSLTLTEGLAFWVQQGTSRFDGNIKLSQSTATAAQTLTLLNAPTATGGGDPDVYLNVLFGSNTYVIPAWQI